MIFFTKIGHKAMDPGLVSYLALAHYTTCIVGMQCNAVTARLVACS
jgi:hypothetical protein